MSGSEVGASVTGSLPDIVSRMRAVLPFSWFPAASSTDTADETPVLTSVLSGIGTSWAFCYTLLAYVRLQARLATVNSCFLDLFATDFFGSVIRREVAEADNDFRLRLKTNLLIPRATRASLANSLLQLTGVTARIVEPNRSSDTGGFGVAALAYGSGQSAFQYLVSLDANGGVIRRETDASFIDAGGRLQIAPRHTARPLYVDGQWTSFVVEPAGINMLKDSAGWGGLSASAAGSPITWSISSNPATALWASHPALLVTVGGAATSTGPSMSLLVGTGPVCASIWVFVPSHHTLTDLHLAFGLPAAPQTAAADLSIVDAWQRLVVAIPAVQGAPATVKVQLAGASSGGMINPIITQCWQVEAGTGPTSYIPSAGQVGIRDGDRVVGNLGVGNNPVVLDQAAIGAAMGRVIPAGSLAWLALRHTQ